MAIYNHVGSGSSLLSVASILASSLLRGSLSLQLLVLSLPPFSLSNHRSPGALTFYCNWTGKILPHSTVPSMSYLCLAFLLLYTHALSFLGLNEDYLVLSLGKAVDFDLLVIELDPEAIGDVRR